MSASVIHVIVLPYLDLTLMACNASTAIICNLVLSKKFLGEMFVWKYDCTALVLISAGCTTIVLNAHTSQTKYDREAVVDVLLSARTMIYFISGLVYFFTMLMMIKCYLAKLRLFERDVDFFDAAQANKVSNYEPILEPRLKKGESMMNNGEEESTRENTMNGGTEPLMVQENCEQDDEVERPPRTLIETISEMTEDEVKQVSPNSLTLKKFVKIPLLLIVTSSAVMAGISISLIKMAVELLESNDFWEIVLFSIFLLIGALLFSFTQLHMLNGAMKFYDQLVVMPIYQTSIMISWILSGMIVFKEIDYYTNKELIFISCSMIVCCIGIYFLYSKTKYIKESQQQTNRSSRSTIINSADSL